MRYFLSIATLLMIALPAMAQEITPQPICFTVRNEAPYKAYGQIATNYYTTTDGTKARHTGTFRLETSGTTDTETGNLKDRSEFCVSGPFYPGRQIELTLRTLIPVFSCKTNIEMGEIVIHGKFNDDGSTKTWATCY
ncbi:MAG: hypothetical protein ACRBDI_04690 [Alphaproteobacteria bacterium]